MAVNALAYAVTRRDIEMPPKTYLKAVMAYTATKSDQIMAENEAARESIYG